MTVHARDANFRQPKPGGQTCRHDILDLDIANLSKRFVIFTPSGEMIKELVELGHREIGAVAPAELVERAVTHNPDNLWAVARRSRFDAAKPKAEGFFAFLMLNTEGLHRLGDGTFDGVNPDFALLSAQNERPAGIYAWAVCAPRGMTAALPLVMEKISTPLYRKANMYTNAATEEGARFLEAIGLKRGATIHGHVHPKMFWLDRSGFSDEPGYDSYSVSQPEKRIGISVVRTIDDLMRVFAIRSAVYMAEQHCPYEEEFDGNDFCATHLLGYIGDEPAGCMRVRCFADFAKVERVAIRNEFRNTRLVQRLIRASIAICRAKGYCKLYGQPRSDLLRFYSRFGFRTFDGARTLRFSDVDYTEVVLDLDRQADALQIGVDPYVLIRPEGRWHKRGILERSAERRPKVGPNDFPP